MLAPVLKNACVQVICHKPLVCHGKCSFSLFLSSDSGYNLDTQKFPFSDSGIPHSKTATQSLFFYYLCFVLICYPNAMCSVQVVETIHLITDKLSNFNSCCSIAF